MAVVQISRIQIRRGKANTGTGIPQLASGEMAWAVDTQELYIGSGSVSEGAPAVDNIKVITELDLNVNGNILNLLQYIYKVADPGMQTGVSPNIPTLRSIQDRLDDQVNVADFGANGLGGTTDDTAALQRAINELFLNTTRSKASANTPDGVRTRLLLEVPAGTYNLSSTLYIPSYASLVGRGPGKSIINFTGTGSAIQFINDNSTIDGNDPTSSTVIVDPLSNTAGNTQPRNILIKDLTIQVNSNNQTAFQLDAVRDSIFENVDVVGNWGNTPNNNGIGFQLNVVSSIVTCENNIFKNVNVKGFTYAVYTKQDVLSNTFRDCSVAQSQNGFVLGYQTNTNVVGQQYGPRDTVISNCSFNDIKHYAVYIGVGTANSIDNIKLVNVGNEGAGNSQAQFPQVFIDSVGNDVKGVQSDRGDDLSYEISTVMLTLSAPITASKGTAVLQPGSSSIGSLYRNEVSSTNIRVITSSTFDAINNLTIGADVTPSDSNTAVHPTSVGTLNKTPYVPEVSGHATYTSYASRKVDIQQLTGYGLAFRLPLACDDQGNPWRDVSYDISYIYRSTANNFSRRGNMRVIVDVDASTSLGVPMVQLSDDFEFTGNDTNEAKALTLDFRAKLLKADGSYYTGAVGTTPHSLAIEYTNSLSGDSGKLIYSYTANF